MEDRLPEGHPERFLVENVVQRNLRSLKDSYTGRGSQANSPVMPTVFLFYGDATGVFSGRKRKRSTRDSVSFRHPAPSYGPACNMEMPLKTGLEALAEKAEGADRTDLPDGLPVPEVLGARQGFGSHYRSVSVCDFRKVQGE